MLRLLEKYEADFIVLARFMKILSPNFVWRLEKQDHQHSSFAPARVSRSERLPPGLRAWRSRVVGVTAHFVTPNLDEGPIIAQEVLRVGPREPLARIVRRGQALETRCVLRAVRIYLTRRLDVHWGRVYS